MRPHIFPLANLANVVLVGLGVLYLAEHAADRYEGFSETRFYRDWHNLTPFYDVIVYYPVIAEPDRIVMSGEMIKRRCEFFDLRGWALFTDEPSVRTPVDTSVEDARGVSGNRVPSPEAASWGPWSLEWDAERRTPDGWRIDAGHWCPVLDENGNEVINHVTGEPRTKYETNTFASGPWAALLDEVTE